jgi:hypothetical protein
VIFVGTGVVVVVVMYKMGGGFVSMKTVGVMAFRLTNQGLHFVRSMEQRSRGDSQRTSTIDVMGPCLQRSFVGWTTRRAWKESATVNKLESRVESVVREINYSSGGEGCSVMMNRFTA